jgi:hypothetical protein
MRFAHLSCKNKERKIQTTLKVPEKTSITIKKPKPTKNSSGETVTYQSLGPLMGKHQEEPRRRPRIRCLPDRRHHAALDLN